MRAPLILALTLLAATSAGAAEPSGCDKFKWPIERDRAALTAPDRAALASGGALTAASGKAVTLGLKPLGEANLPSPPERKQADDSFGGFVSVAAPAQAGSYTISLSAAAWVDVTQDGKNLKPAAFSGATDCDGIRKTMKFDLAAKPLTLQISGVKADKIDLLVQPTP